MSHLILIALLACAGGACATRGLTSTLDGDPTTGIPWSATRLRWSDFRGAPPPGIPNLALTVYRWAVSVNCTGSDFSYRVQSRFLTQASWVSRALLTSPTASRRALEHEQTHFDLSEVHARRLRQFYAGLPEPCRRTTDELEALAGPYLAADDADQERYDADTRNGRDELRQARWDAEVQRWLIELTEFAAE